MTEEQIKFYRQASGEVWTLFKEYIGIKKDDDEKWEELILLANKVGEKYKGTPAEEYTKNYIVKVVMAEIEAVSKK